MKLNRKTLRKLIIESINETRIKPSLPFADDESYDMAQPLARHDNPESQGQADYGAYQLGYPEMKGFSQGIRDYDIAGRVTIETVSSMTPEGRHELDVQIPYDMVDGVIDAYQQVMQGGGSHAEDLFKSRATAISNYIDNQVTDGVYEYGIKVGGYRAKEYQAAMFAVGEYL